MEMMVLLTIDIFIMYVYVFVVWIVSIYPHWDITVDVFRCDSQL